MRRATEDWILSAHDDVDTIAEIIDNPKLTNVAAFHAQQCVEKSFKAMLEEFEQDVPAIHNLITLLGRVESRLPEPVDEDMLDRLNQLYVEARYPGERGLFPEGKPDMDEAIQLFRFARHVLVMVERQL